MNTRSSIRYAAAASFRWRLPKATAALPFVFATAFAGSLRAATAQADPLIVGNNAGQPGVGPIQTYDFATGGAPVASFVPTGALPANNGRGLAVFGNKVYYTEVLYPEEEPSDAIHVAPFNGGAGGADIKTLPNPAPTTGISDLAVANGVLYALTGYNVVNPGTPRQVFGLNSITGVGVSGPVTISGPVTSASEGFTVLPNGNFLITTNLLSCTYSQFDPSTGAVIPGTTIVVPGTNCTGVDTDGTSLYFQVNFTSFTKTDLAGVVVATRPVTLSCGRQVLQNVMVIG